MDKYVAVPVELSAEMLEAWERRGIERVKLAMAGVESITPYRTSIKETYAVALAAAPTTHVAVKRELLEQLIRWISAEENYTWKQEIEVVAELRALLSGE